MLCAEYLPILVTFQKLRPGSWMVLLALRVLRSETGRFLRSRADRLLSERALVR